MLHTAPENALNLVLQDRFDHCPSAITVHIGTPSLSTLPFYNAILRSSSPAFVISSIAVSRITSLMFEKYLRYIEEDIDVASIEADN